MRDITDLDFTQKEARQICQMNHVNIVKYENEFVHIENQTLYFCIILEFCPHGDLTDFIRQQKTPLSVGKIRQIFREICYGVQYVHTKNVVHRDIKSPNIFIGNKQIIKVGDFGLS